MILVQFSFSSAQTIFTLLFILLSNQNNFIIWKSLDLFLNTILLCIIKKQKQKMETGGRNSRNLKNQTIENKYVFRMYS